MKELHVKTDLKTYPIYIGDSFDNISECFRKAGLKGKAVIVTDSNVAKIYLDEFKKSMTGCFDYICEYIFAAGEESKNLDTIKSMYDFFVENKLDRKSVVIALGGGVTGDMAGFAASTYMRGLKYVQIPTTLLAQSDSSVGGKTGVDFSGKKNMIGSFYQPEFVYINTDVLKTLSDEHFKSGLCEIIKLGFIMDKDFLDYIFNNKESIYSFGRILKNIIYKACEIKADVVNQDEKEEGIRAILNFGHTFGHSIEALYDFSIPHGLCVCIGMAAALYLSKQKGNITEKEMEYYIDMLEHMGMPVYIEKKKGIDSKSVYEVMTHDKKVSGGKLNFILLNKIGEACIDGNIDKESVIDTIDFILK